MLVTGLPSMVAGMTSSPAAEVLHSVMVPPSKVRSSKPAAWSGRNAQAKSARRAWSGFMMHLLYHTLGRIENRKVDRVFRANPVSLTMNRESGYGIRGSVWRLLLAVKSDTDSASSTHREARLSPPVGLIISLGNYNRLRMMFYYRMRETRPLY
jgi:hypothetical protein